MIIDATAKGRRSVPRHGGATQTAGAGRGGGLVALTVAVAVLPLGASADGPEPDRWRLTLTTPAAHLSHSQVACTAGCAGREDRIHTYALGAALRIERWAAAGNVSGELGAQMASPTGDVRYPLQVRGGIGVPRLVLDRAPFDIQAVPRIGLLYHRYYDAQDASTDRMVGPWAGLLVEALWWKAGSVAFSVGLDSRAAYWWDRPYGRTNGIMVIGELVLGVTIGP